MILGDLLRTLFRGRRSGEPSKPTASSAPPYLPKYSTPDKSLVSSFFFPMFWGTADDKSEKLADGVYFGDNLLTWARNLSMLDDGPFVAAWKDNVENNADKAIVWRRYVLACAAYHCVQLEGDFVECGAYTGVGVKTVVDYLGGPAFPKTFWCYDLFEHDDTMLNHAMPGHGEGLYERVRKKFARYPQVRILKGRIPEVFADGCPERIAYLHIDLNQAPAEVASLEHLFDRVVPGGIVILDDYEWSGGYRAQKLAEDAWFDKRQYRVMPLPTGQGLVIKR
jgi:O-methyltransferase